MWVWQNPSGVWEIISDREVNAAHRALNSFYGWFWGDDDQEDKEEPKTSKKVSQSPQTPCYGPNAHRFKKQVLFQVFHHICEKCGYSPTLNVLEGFEECHKKYIEHIKKNPPEDED